MAGSDPVRVVALGPDGALWFTGQSGVYGPPLPSDPGNVRQIHGRPGEEWGAASAADTLVVVRT